MLVEEAVVVDLLQYPEKGKQALLVQLTSSQAGKHTDKHVGMHTCRQIGVSGKSLWQKSRLNQTPYP